MYWKIRIPYFPVMHLAILLGKREHFLYNINKERSESLCIFQVERKKSCH